MDRLLNYDVEIAFAAEPISFEGMATRPVFEEQLVLVAPDSFPPINDIDALSPVQQKEKVMIDEVLKRFARTDNLGKPKARYICFFFNQSVMRSTPRSSGHVISIR